MAKYRVLKLIVEKILMYNKINGKSGNRYEMDLDQPEIYASVVDEELRMENCALFDQFCFELGVNVVGDEISDVLIHKFVIVDFSSIYKQNPIPKEEAVRFLIEHGFTLCHKQEKIHFVAFDKSGNMSRKCRLSFISSEYLEAMNRRLNLDMHFGKVKLNKYYAYRGLYLSTAKRVNDPEFKITPETLVIVDDQINKEYAPYQKDVPLYKGILQKNHSVLFQKGIAKFQDIDVPYDGQGIVSPSFANRMVQSLGGEERNSFQIRLPFVKGMLHRVDFHGFLAEYASGWNGNGSYTIPDAFGINRDLKKAQIIMTKSMFKCFSWLVAQDKVAECDPMQFYCDKLEVYGHALYVSATDLPYGKSLVTHTSYQLLNTLALNEERFKALIDENLAYASNPITYLKKTHGYCVEENEKNCGYSNWQRAVILNPAFAKLPYIKQQLTNIQTAIMTKIALGKLIVSGQTRFIARDLLSMVINLIASEETKTDLLKNKIFSYRFYMPQGMEGEQPRNPMKLEYEKYCGFYRSPHLSRNEQVLLAPITGNWVKMLHKYFAHLTGIVMVGNESIEPMALGGADFDGDLVSVITNENVVNAIKESNYTLSSVPNKPLDINRKWFEKYPYANGWLREYLKQYLSEDENWQAYSDKWCDAWKESMAYKLKQLVYPNIIAQALARGELKEYVLVTKKCDDFFADIQDEKGKRPPKGRRATLLKLIAAYKILQLQQPGQKYVLMPTNRILNWCGYNSYKSDRMCPDLRWKNAPLVLVESHKDFRKFRIHSDFLSEMEIQLIEKKEAANIDHERYDIYQDYGHGKDKGLEKMVMSEGYRRRG